MNTNETVNELIDLFTGQVITKEQNEVLYRAVRLIYDLEDQAKMYKSMLHNQSNLDGSNH